MKHRRPMCYVVWAMVVMLIILHQDNWLWDNPKLVFGFLPITLLYQVCISLAATVTWFLATRFAWPLDDEALQPPAATPEQQGGGGA